MTNRDHVTEKIREHQNARLQARYPRICRAMLVLAELSYERRDQGWIRTAVAHGKACAEQGSCWCGFFPREDQTDVLPEPMPSGDFTTPEEAQRYADSVNRLGALTGRNFWRKETRDESSIGLDG